MSTARLTPIKAIRAKCLDCCCGSSNEVRLCPCPECSLYPYRFGKNPYIRLTDEQKAKRGAYLKKTPSYMGEKSNIPAGEGRDTLKGEDDFLPCRNA